MPKPIESCLHEPKVEPPGEAEATRVEGGATRRSRSRAGRKWIRPVKPKVELPGEAETMGAEATREPKTSGRSL